MTYYATSSIAEIIISEAHGGCGESHKRPVGADGTPQHPWGVTCPQCESFLANDPLWARTVPEIPETPDERLAREQYEVRGSRDKEALMLVAMARMAGIDQPQIPPTVQKMISGLAPHIPGQTVCPRGHANVPGGRFCSSCGSAMSAPAPAASLTAGQAA